MIRKRLTEEEQQYILKNYHKMTVKEMSNNIGRLDETIRNFLCRNRLKIFTKGGYGYNLSPKEEEVFSLIARGKSIKEIAKLTKREPSTIKTHLNSIYLKLQINNKVCLASYYWKNNVEKLKNLNIEELLRSD